MIYIASPFFNTEEKNCCTILAHYLRTTGEKVYLPMEHEIPNAWELSNADWAKKVFDEDIKALKECDEVYVINHGMYSDSGTAWECGFAYALGKTIINCIIKNNEVYSLMMVNGSTKTINFWNTINEKGTPINFEQK